MPKRIAILGSGSWGLAIANLLYANGENPVLWEFNPDDYQILLRNRTHPKKLPNIRIPDEVLITNNLKEAIQNASYIILAVPSQKVRKVCENLKSLLQHSPYIINLAKGVEMGTLQRISEVVDETLPGFGQSNFAVLSGPSHAEEVSQNMPTSVVTASKNSRLADDIQHLFSNNTFRVYRSSDLIGVELGGSLKNIMILYVIGGIHFILRHRIHVI